KTPGALTASGARRSTAAMPVEYGAPGCNLISSQGLDGRTSRSATRHPTIDIVSRLQRVVLPPAERNVAKIDAADFQAATRMTIAELAELADVSQPIVTLFCRPIGCGSFAEFYVSLANTLVVVAAYLTSDRAFDDDAGKLAQTVMMRVASAVRERLDQI